jgi:protein TonB
MADVLIVCVREDEPQAKALADTFERAGFSVGGAPSNDSALRSSGAGIVVWSHASIRSRPFLDAAQRVVSANKAVVACLIEPPPPSSISDSPAFDLSGWTGDPDDPVLDPLFFAVDRMVNTARAAVGAPAAQPANEPFDPPPSLRPPPSAPPYARSARTAPPAARQPPAAQLPPGFSMRTPTPAPTPMRAPPSEPSNDPLRSEAEHWRAIRHSTDPTAFLDYLARYGADGAFAELADQRLQNLQQSSTPRMATRTPEPQARRPEPAPPRRREQLPERAYEPERLFESPREPARAYREEQRRERRDEYRREEYQAPVVEEPKRSSGGALRFLILLLLLGGGALGAGYYFGVIPAQLGLTTQESAAPETTATDAPAAAEPENTDDAAIPDAASTQTSAPPPVDFASGRPSAAPRTAPALRPTSPTVEEPEPPTPAPRYSWSDPAPPASGGPVSLIANNSPTTSVPPLEIAAAPAPTPPPPRGTLSWAQRPTAERIAALYPRRAARDSVGGRADLDCTVRADLGVTCGIASETPAGAGFGQAALSAVTSYRARPTLSDGVSAVGARTRVSIVFRAAE